MCALFILSELTVVCSSDMILCPVLNITSIFKVQKKSNCELEGIEGLELHVLELSG